MYKFNKTLLLSTILITGLTACGGSGLELSEDTSEANEAAVAQVEQWLSSQVPAGSNVTITSAAIDLNGDGVDEVFVRVENMYMCSGENYKNGCQTYFMSLKDDEWDNMGYTYANEIEALSESHNDYLDLNIDGETFIHNGRSYGAE